MQKAMAQYAWVSYSGTARMELAIVLLAVAGGLLYAGARLHLPIAAARPARAVVIFMLLTWVLVIATFLVGVSVYAQQAQREQAAGAAPVNHVMPVTFIAAGITFVIILICSPGGGWGRLVSAAIGAMAAPMIFELPFDLIVMARTYPPVIPDPALYRALFFLPLFLIEIVTLALLVLSPMVKLSKASFFSFALMLIVFAAWGLLGFAYPSGGTALALNVVSKILAFVTALCLFLPQRARAGADDSRARASNAIM
jgi:hypothetical protein